MNIKGTLTEGQRKILFEIVADTQDGKMKEHPRMARASCLRNPYKDPINEFLAYQVELADEPHDVHNACQYAVDELNRAAFAASAYGDKLEQEATK